MTRKPRVLILDERYREAAGQLATEYPELELLTRDEDGASEADVLLAQDASVSADLLDSLGQIAVILKMGRNYSNIDLAAAKKKGAQVAYLPRKGPNCVAELATTMILALSKDLLMSHQAVVSGAYKMRGLRPVETDEKVMAFMWMANERLHEVPGRTLGIIGFGEIGQEIGRRARVLGMNIHYHKRTQLPDDIESQYDATYHPELQSLLKESDYVCVTVPQTEHTVGLLGREELELIGKDGYLVNVARGAIVDEDALVTVLQQDLIAGAGLDVFVYEPLRPDHPLCQLDNVILTPHMGGGTGTSPAIELNRALAEVRRITCEGAEPVHPVAL